MNVMAGYWCNLYLGTEAELSIEPAIAALGIPYRTQFPMFLFRLGKYFPDFLLPTIGVVLEVDDESHEEEEKKKADALRTSALESLGYLVVRCTNEEALQDPVGTVKRLVTPHLARKGPGLPPASQKKTKGKKYGTRSRNPARNLDHPTRAGRLQAHQGVKDQGRRHAR